MTTGDVTQRAAEALRWWAEGGTAHTSSIVGSGAVERCEDEIAIHLGGGLGLAVASGTMALRAALAAVGVGAGDEVLVPDLDWGAARAAALSLGATPVAVATPGPAAAIDPGAVAASVTSRTRAVVVTHLFGWAADTAAVRAAAPGLPIVEDCAQALGARRGGRRCGADADIAVCSFGPGKIVDAGEGGAVVTRDPVLHRAAVRATQHPTRQRLAGVAAVDHTGLVSRIHPVAAAMACYQLRDLDERVADLDAQARRVLVRLAVEPGLRTAPADDLVLSSAAVPTEVDIRAADPTLLAGSHALRLEPIGRTGRGGSPPRGPQPPRYLASLRVNADASVRTR